MKVELNYSLTTPALSHCLQRIAAVSDARHTTAVHSSTSVSRDSTQITTNRLQIYLMARVTRVCGVRTKRH